MLRAVRLTGAVFFRVEATAPWVIEMPDASALAAVTLPRAQHVISYHVVTRGSCYGAVPGDSSARLEEGDVLVVPRLLHVRQAFAADEPLARLIDFAIAESQERRAGGECVRLRLSELMFVEVVRRHLAGLPAEQTGWLAGLRDRIVGRALALLHERPGDDWTIERLAQDVGLSRSALAERFTHFVGDPPMQYLTRWRMQAAARLLTDGQAKVSAVALQVGYDSEAAFSRAFKKVAGVPPAAWRRRYATPTRAAAAGSPRPA